LGIHTLSDALRHAIQSTTLESIRRAGSYDVVVIGAGASGGMAALSLAEQGARVLVLDAGQRRKLHDAPFTTLATSVVNYISQPGVLEYVPPAAINFGRKLLRGVGKVRQPIQSKCYAWERDPLAFVDDRKNPYVVAEGTNFDWFRARQIGGRMTIPGHGCQYYRLYPEDFRREEDGVPVWPFGPEELDPWYDIVERRLDLKGLAEPCTLLPESRLRATVEPTEKESMIRRRLSERWPGMQSTVGRWSPPLNSMELAARTGRLSCRQGAIGREVEVDPRGHVQGVRWVDTETGRVERVSAGKVFVCASTLETTRILMLSRDASGRQGLGASSGRLGRYLMDHVGISAHGIGPSIAKEDPSFDTRRCVFIPRFDLQTGAPTGTGFSAQIYVTPLGDHGSMFNAVTFSEMAPRMDSGVSLDPSVKDAWGIPALRIETRYSAAEKQSAIFQTQALVEIASALGATSHPRPTPPPGTAIHECGTARMGRSPETSVLDANNECWDARGLYVTDGASLPSQGINNPTLTLMALTARACAHAASAKG